MKKIYFLVLLITQFFVSNALDLKGTVTDNISKTPIAKALVRIQINGIETGRTNTKSDGTFALPLERNVDYKVYIDMLGYEQTRLDISTKFAATINEIPALEIELNKLKTNNSVSSTTTNATTTTNNTGTINNNINSNDPSIIVLLKGKVYHAMYGGLAGEQVILKNINTGETKIDNTIANGNYLLQLEPNKNYSLTVKGIAGNPLYEYETFFISTTGVQSSVQVIRNFENKAIIYVIISDNSSETKTTQAVTAPTTSKSKKVKKDIVARNVVVKITDVNDKEENIRTVNSATDLKKIEDAKKAEALKTAEMQKKKDAEMLALKVEAEKKLEATRQAELQKQKENQSKLDEQKKLELQKKKEAEMLALKLEAQKKLDASKQKEQANQIAIDKKIAEEKRLATEKEIALQKEKEAKIIAEQKVIIEKQKTETKTAEEKKLAVLENNKRLDSIVAYGGTRFMHKEKTIEDVQRETANTNNTNIKNPLPISVDENRTPVINDIIYFGPGKGILDEEAKKYLLDIANKLKSDANLKLDISIHADANDELSVSEYLCKLRLKNISDLLINTYKVNFSQLTIRNTGSDQGANTCKKGDANCSELDHQMNRRIELHFIQ